MFFVFFFEEKWFWFLCNEDNPETNKATEHNDSSASSVIYVWGGDHQAYGMVINLNGQVCLVSFVPSICLVLWIGDE